jgi:D-arabinose 1-dehydrogenase-like Zn-dependent alcohol dehydrogenase
MRIGITTWSPFVHHKITSKHRVGIIGVGGLGHIGLQFSVKLGAHTTGISTSNNKRDEVLRFGAQAFINSSDEKDMKAAAVCPCQYPRLRHSHMLIYLCYN